MKTDKGGDRVGLQVAKWGNSLAVRLPAESAKRLGISEGDTLIGEIAADGRLILSAQAQPIGKAVVRRMRAFLEKQKPTTPVVGDMRKGARY